MAIDDEGAAGGSPRRLRNRSVTSGPALWLTLLASLLASCMLPAAAQAVGAVYVANAGNANVSQFAIVAGGRLSPLSPVTVEASIPPYGPQAVAITPDGKSAYVTSSENTVWQYDINQATGALSSKVPGTVATGNGLPHGGIAVTPNGKSAYVTNLTENTVSQYDISPTTGALSPKAAATVATGKHPSGIGVTPDGKSAYVTNSEDKTVSQYTINAANGELEAKSPATVAADFGPTGVAVTPDGKSAYVHNAGTISQYDIDSEGKLSPKAPATVPAGLASGSDDTTPIAVSPDGKSLYATDEGNVSPRVLQYGIDSEGKLSPKSPAYVESENVNPTNIALTPDGKSAYVTNALGKSVSLYDINPLTGTLSPKTPAKATVGEFPEGIAVGLPPVAHPTSTSVSCSPASVVAGNSTPCKATVTDTASNGQATPTGTIDFSSGGPGSFGSGSSCPLAEAGPGVASCQASYTPSATPTTPVRYDTITVTYGGDYLHTESSGSQSVQVLSIGLLTSGSFVIGDQDATVGNPVTFWGAQWSKLNRLSGGEAPSSFKGLASTTSANPPVCEDDWSTSPGNSAPTPAAPLPEYMAVIVSRKVNKSGSVISGSADHVVVVKTSPGYAPDPGHPGTGMVVAQIC